jgi:hypothetical protein
MSCILRILKFRFLRVATLERFFEVLLFRLEFGILDDLNGSVGSIADLIPKGPGFESQISHGFPSCKRG